jgi:hypothetical protein
MFISNALDKINMNSLQAFLAHNMLSSFLNTKKTELNSTMHAAGETTA